MSHDEIPLSDLPLFRDIKEDLSIQQQEQQALKNNKQPRFSQTTRNKTQISRNTQQGNNSRGTQYVPPLSAYSANEEAPYFPSGRHTSAGRFDELSMRYEQTQQRFKSIRTPGWSFLTPLGINSSIQGRKEKRLNEMHRVPDEPTALGDDGRLRNLTLPTDFQENGSDTNFHDLEINNEHDFGPEEMTDGNRGGEDNVDTGGHNDDSVNHEEDDDDDDNDDDASYDYDAEFARVEDEHEHEEQEERRHYSNRRIVRDVTIQQFVETSHVDRNPYEIDEEYEESHSNVDNGDSGDFTEIPWVDVSDTVQSVDSSRVTSLNSHIDRQAVPGRNLRRHRHVPDNNSDQSIDSIRQ